MAITPDEVSFKGGWVFSVEGALVANAMGKAATAHGHAHGLTDDEWRIGLTGVAAKFLAVGTPRTLGLVGAGARARDLVAAQCSYAAPRELRVYEEDATVAEAIAADLAGPAMPARAVSLPQACACDIVVVAAPVAIRREHVRAGTLVTVLEPSARIDPELLAAAHVHLVDDSVPTGMPVHATLAAVAAGLVDGRALDEIIVLLV